MPRPRKCRKVCCLPENTEFVPVGRIQNDKVVIMTVDEYETIRLIDKENFSQEKCGEYMGIARTTVQQIYNNARRKIAAAVVDGIRLKIEGGDYKLCDGKEKYAGAAAVKSIAATGKLKGRIYYENCSYL